MTKTETRKWLKRMREDIRDAERALQRDDWGTVHEMMLDASGAAAQILQDQDAQ